MFSRLPAFFATLSIACAQPADSGLIDKLRQHALAFRERAPRAIGEETLVQRAYTMPPHSRVAIGRAAEPLYSRFFVHEIVSEYSIGVLKGDRSGALLEFRQVTAKDGVPARPPDAARQALARDISLGEDRIRKKMLEELTALGLVDVATDYGPILLAFVDPDALNLQPAGSAFIGAQEATVFDWRQRDGGALEFRGRKTTRQPMRGQIWLRVPDGLPLRVTAALEHADGRHELRDAATIDFAPSAIGCVVPASVVHRHLVDGAVLTENLYTYAGFRFFTSESTIRYGDAPVKK